MAYEGNNTLDAHVETGGLWNCRGRAVCTLWRFGEWRFSNCFSISVYIGVFRALFALGIAFGGVHAAKLGPMRDVEDIVVPNLSPYSEIRVSAHNRIVFSISKLKRFSMFAVDGLDSNDIELGMKCRVDNALLRRLPVFKNLDWMHALRWPYSYLRHTQSLIPIREGRVFPHRYHFTQESMRSGAYAPQAVRKPRRYRKCPRLCSSITPTTIWGRVLITRSSLTRRNVRGTDRRT